MLNPCSPCVCSGAPCEQCMFGYRSKEENHKTMKELFTAVEAGEKPSGWKCVEIYKSFHSDWQEEFQKKSLKDGEEGYICEELVKEPLIFEPNEWSEEEWEALLHIFGMEKAERIVISNYKFEAWGKPKPVITLDQWNKAYEHLKTYMLEYAAIGPSGQFGLYGILVPLHKRYTGGERTSELYEAMMGVE